MYPGDLSDTVPNCLKSQRIIVETRVLTRYLLEPHPLAIGDGVLVYYYHHTPHHGDRYVAQVRIRGKQQPYLNQQEESR